MFSLGEVVRPNRPRVKPESMPDAPFIGMEHIEAHTMKLLGTVPAATMKSSAVHFKPGDVLYGRLRPYLNKVFRPLGGTPIYCGARGRTVEKWWCSTTTWHLK
jgi:type I restriction enzyme S subunit